MKCELKYCLSGLDATIFVNEHIGDGSWRVGICRKCAWVLGLKSGDDLPSDVSKIHCITEDIDQRDPIGYLVFSQNPTQDDDYQLFVDYIDAEDYAFDQINKSPSKCKWPIYPLYATTPIIIE